MSAPEFNREQALKEFQERYGLGALPAEKLDLAFTHRSYAFEQGGLPDNERLEFLGDALIGAVASEYLYERHPDEREGELSKRRSHLVSRSMLGRRAAEMGVGELLLLGRGERQTGGARRRSSLGSALEALAGVIYMELGYPAMRAFAERHVIEPLASHAQGVDLHGDYKSALQEWAQRVHNCLPRYERIGDSGPDHAKAFNVAVSVAGQRLAEGGGPRIRVAENEAARKALRAIGAGTIDAGELPGADEQADSSAD